MTSDEAEIDRRLTAAPQDVHALVAKGDHRALAGDEKAAVAFYRAALGAAAARGGPLPMSFKAPIERAQAQIAAATRRFNAHLETVLAGAGFPQGRRPPRFQQALDLLRGRATATLNLQRPTTLYYPGLPQRRYYERADLPWAAAIEAQTPTILAELERWQGTDGGGFRPYLTSDPNQPRYEFHGLNDNPAWSTLYIWEQGGPVAAVQDHFPETLAAVTALPLPHITVRAPSVLFSRLGPGARIPPHHGMLNTRLVCHLPLIVPPDCGFRVGGETRAWEPGKLIVFDDTVEHEAWNDSAEDRIVLIFDVWRPELDERERGAITALFQALDG